MPICLIEMDDDQGKDDDDPADFEAHRCLEHVVVLLSLVTAAYDDGAEVMRITVFEPFDADSRQSK